MNNTKLAFSDQRSVIREEISLNARHHALATTKGFTLIETLVAISVLLISLAGPLSIAAQALQSAYYARDQVTAFYLAQEGIEYVRVYRDQNYLTDPSGDWLQGIRDCVGTDALCTIDFPNFDHTVCAGECDPLLLSSTEKLFNTEDGEETIFTRIVRLVPVANNPNEMIIESTITWRSAGINRSFRLTERIFDWL